MHAGGKKEEREKKGLKQRQKKVGQRVE